MKNSNWVIDPTHSVVRFEITHLMIATLTGRFNDIGGVAESDENFENATFTFEANANSVSTNDEKRDAHLKSADFFDAEKFPKLTFTSTQYTKTGDKEFELTGNLTIREVTKPVTLKIKYGGTAVDPWGNTKAGFEIKGKINRKDFGLVWNATIESGGVLVSEEVRLIANIEFLKK